MTDDKPRNLDPNDASRLSFLTYLVKRYGPSSQTKAIFEKLQTKDAKNIAKVILGEPTSSKRAHDIATVYDDWFKSNVPSKR